jgi:hypothetical protein
MSKCTSTFSTTYGSECGYTPVLTYTSTRVIEHVLIYSFYIGGCLTV